MVEVNDSSKKQMFFKNRTKNISYNKKYLIRIISHKNHTNNNIS